MKLALVALPWSVVNRPSAALGALSAYVRQKVEGVEVDCLYEYIEVARAISLPTYTAISEHAYEVGELLYAPMVHPERRDACVGYCADPADRGLPIYGLERDKMFADAAFADVRHDWAACVGRTIDLLASRLDAFADSIALSYDCVGLTTCFGQLFANIALAKRLKQRNPAIKIVVGGSTLSGYVGPSIIKEYPWLDYVVQGEGELPFSELIRHLSRGLVPAETTKGLLTQANAEKQQKGAQLWEVPSMDDLPFPNYDEYALAIAGVAADWLVPVEGSRGCWWDRTKRSGNAKKTCFFCNLNIQWNGYREKSIPRLTAEIEALVDHHENPRLFFLDNIIRLKGIEELADALIATDRDLNLFYEMRANVSSHQIFRLWESGLDHVQFGIEGLSTAYLRRIGKGTLTIQNLLVMKTCRELHILNSANLLTDFPGATPEEVQETTFIIKNFAYAYQPLRTCHFWLGSGSTVDTLHKEFPITNVRNRDFYRCAVPAEVYERVRFFDLSYDLEPGAVDWSPVRDAAEWWKVNQSARGGAAKPLIQYVDGGNFLKISYIKEGEEWSLSLNGFRKSLYLYCLEIRTLTDLVARFGQHASEDGIREILDGWFEERILFREGDRFLALALAPTLKAAIKRLSALHPQLAAPSARCTTEQAITA